MLLVESKAFFLFFVLGKFEVTVHCMLDQKLRKEAHRCISMLYFICDLCVCERQRCRKKESARSGRMELIENRDGSEFDQTLVLMFHSVP